MPDEKTGVASFHESFAKLCLTQGRGLVNQIAIMVKVAQMHDIKNEAVEKAAENVMGMLRLFFIERSCFALNLVGDYFYIEDFRVKYNVEDFANFEYLAGEFRRRKLGALHFDSGLEAAGLISFTSVFLDTDTSSEEVYPGLAGGLAEAGVTGISTEELRPAKEEENVEMVLDAVKAAKAAYGRVLHRITELYDLVERGQPPDIRKLKRAVQSLVDSVYRSEPVLLRLSALRKNGGDLPRHYTNVTVLSLGIGRRFGLSRYQMARLGMAAALHDIGRHWLPEGIFDREELSEEELRLVAGHPRLGVQTLLKLKGLNEVAVSAMIVAYEHHMNLDGTGYPPPPRELEMGLFSRIVRVADSFDAATSSGIYGRVAMPPDRALELMLGRAGSYYDGTVLTHFYGMVGRYPVGSLVLLSDGSVGVVSAPGGGLEGLERPRVEIIAGPEGAAARGPVELSEADGTGAYTRHVVRALDPGRYNVNVYRHLL